MKSALASILVLACSLCAGAAEQIYIVVEGEDATSTHYYFYYSNGESVEKVRWVWNGGAQNKPTVTEYLFESGAIRIKEMDGPRELIDALLNAEEPPMSTISEYRLVRKGEEKLVPPDSDKTLSKTQRIDLSNLIGILAKERKPFKQKPPAK